MIINQTQQVTKAGLQPGRKYKAIVTDNADPKGACRIRFTIKGVFEFEKGPWAIAGEGGGDGTTGNTGRVNIPKVGSKILIEFQNGSPYHPIYYSSPQDISTLLAAASINYPNRIVERYSNGLEIIYDTKTNEVLISNPGDVGIKITGNTTLSILDGNLDVSVSKGSASIFCKKDVSARIEGELTATVTGNISVESKEGSATVKAKKLYLDGGSGECVGVITGKSICQVTGAPHIDPSVDVFASTGGSQV